MIQIPDGHLTEYKALRDRMILEAQVRLWRDAVFNHTCTDDEWAKCKNRWMHPDEVEWLRRQVK